MNTARLLHVFLSSAIISSSALAQEPSNEKSPPFPPWQPTPGWSEGSSGPLNGSVGPTPFPIAIGRFQIGGSLLVQSPNYKDVDGNVHPNMQTAIFPILDTLTGKVYLCTRYFNGPIAPSCPNESVLWNK